MNQSLSQGENTSLQGQCGQLTVIHEVGQGLDVNLTAFLLTDEGVVIDDSGMVFFNAPDHASGSASFKQPVMEGARQQHRIDFDLSKLPAGINRISVALTQDQGSLGFSSVKGMSCRIVVGGQVIDLAPGHFDQETGIVVADIYLRNGASKARAVWQGFASGLAGLCGLYGVDVEETPAEEVPESPPAPVVSLTKSVVTLDKPGSTHTVSLLKGAGAPKVIRVSATWTDNGDGQDNDDLDLRVGILRPDGRMSIIQAPDKGGAFTADPYVLHSGDVVSASASAPGIETVEINPRISELLGGKVALVCSVYSAVANGAVSVASLKPKMRMEYGDQIVDCAFEFKKGFFSSMVYTYVIGLIEIDQDKIVLSPSGETSRTGSEATPWLIRQGGEVRLTMDGPQVFKGHPIERSGKKQYV